MSVVNGIVSELYNHTNTLVIHTPSARKAPPYPYIGYSFINTHSTEGYYKTNLDGGEGGVIERFSSQDRFTLSVSIYSDNVLEVRELSKKCYDFFKFTAYHKLKGFGAVVVNVTGIDNRDMLEIDEYERREGFDVTIRVSNNLDREIESIESYSINEI